MYKIDINFLKSIKDQLADNNKFLKDQNLKFSEFGDNYLDSNVVDQISENNKLIEKLENTYYIK